MHQVDINLYINIDVAALVAEETRIPGENHRPTPGRLKLSHMTRCRL